jgi:hypothetical protein
MTEATVPQPEDPYGVAKYAVELDLRAAHEMFGIDFVVFRPHNVYGPGQNVADKYRNVIGIFMRQLLAGEPMTIFGDGSQTRAFSFIDDVAPQIARAPLLAGARNQVFNVGADRAYTLNELASSVAAATSSSTTTISTTESTRGTTSISTSSTGLMSLIIRGLVLLLLLNSSINGRSALRGRAAVASRRDHRGCTTIASSIRLNRLIHSRRTTLLLIPRFMLRVDMNFKGWLE